MDRGVVGRQGRLSFFMTSSDATRGDRISCRGSLADGPRRMMGQEIGLWRTIGFDIRLGSRVGWKRCGRGWSLVEFPWRYRVERLGDRRAGIKCLQLSLCVEFEHPSPLGTGCSRARGDRITRALQTQWTTSAGKERNGSLPMCPTLFKQRASSINLDELLSPSKVLSWETVISSIRNGGLLPTPNSDAKSSGFPKRTPSRNVEWNRTGDNALEVVRSGLVQMPADLNAGAPPLLCRILLGTPTSQVSRCRCSHR